MNVGYIAIKNKKNEIKNYYVRDERARQALERQHGIITIEYGMKHTKQGELASALLKGFKIGRDYYTLMGKNISCLI